MATDLGVDAALSEEMDCLYDGVHPDFIRWKRGKDGKPKRKFSPKRMGSRHRRMLKQFVRDGGDRKLLAWFQLPKKLFRSEEHTSELQSLMRISYAVFCLKKQKQNKNLLSTYVS